MSANISLFKNGRSGVYYIQYTENDVRKQVSTRCRRKSDALEFLKALKPEPNKKKYRDVAWSVFREEYESYYLGVATPKSFITIKDGFNSFERYLATKPSRLSSITLREAQQYISHLIADVSIHTARKHYITLSAAFQKAVDWKYLEENCWRHVDKPVPPKTDAPFFDVTQFRVVSCAISNSEVQRIAIIAFHTGMRRAEILALKWSSIDFVKRVIGVLNTGTFTTKSKKQRFIPMNDECYAALTEQLQGRADEIMVFSV